MKEANEQKLYLLQVWDNGDFHVYGWTTILARKGYKVLTEEEAQPYLKLSKEGKTNEYYLDVESSRKFKEFKPSDQSTKFAKVDKDGKVEEDENEVAKKLQDLKREEANDNRTLDDIKPLENTQENILELELKAVQGMRHKSQVVAHMLEKYQCEVPASRLDVMKAVATKILQDLGRDGRLYLVDGKITG